MTDFPFELSLGRQPKREPWSIERFVTEHAIAIDCLQEAGTKKNQKSALRSWRAFCQLHDFAILPTVDTLTFYIVFMCSFVIPETVGGYLSGIIAGLEDYYDNIRAAYESVLVKRTLDGCKKHFSRAPNRKLPLLPPDLFALHQTLNLTQYDDLLFWTIVIVGWSNLHRIGELVIPDDPALFSLRKIILCSSVGVNRAYPCYRLPYHKASRFFEGDDCLLQSRPSNLDPVAPFSAYVQRRDACHFARPDLFLRSDGSRPTRAWFMRRFRAFFSNEYAGHSLRSGGATQLALEGMPEQLIQRVGRWSSELYEMYIRKHPMLIHLALQVHRVRLQ